MLPSAGLNCRREFLSVEDERMHFEASARRMNQAAKAQASPLESFPPDEPDGIHERLPAGFDALVHGREIPRSYVVHPGAEQDIGGGLSMAVQSDAGDLIAAEQGFDGGNGWRAEAFEAETGIHREDEMGAHGNGGDNGNVVHPTAVRKQASGFANGGKDPGDGGAC